MRTISIKIDSYRQCYDYIECMQYDDLTLKLTLTQNGVAYNIPSGSTLALNWIKADNTIALVGQNLMSYTNNVVTMSLPRDCTRVAGDARFELVITSSAKQETTFPLSIYITESVLQGQEQSINIATIIEGLNNANNEATLTYIDLLNAISAGDLNTIQSNITSLQATDAIHTSEISNLDTAIDATNSNLALKANTTYVQSLVQSIQSGAPKVYATLTALNSAFPTGDTHAYLVAQDGKWYWWNGSWTAGGTYQSIIPGEYTVSLPTLVNYLRTPIEDLSDYATITPTILSGQYWNIDTKALSNYADLRTTKLTVEYGEKYLISGVIAGVSTALCIFLDANNVQISYLHRGVSTRTTYTNEVVYIPYNCKYMYVTDTTYQPALAVKKLDPFSKVKTLVNANGGRWTGKTWAVLGDSITFGYQTTTKYFEYVQQELGIATVLNYGISGSTITKKDDTDTTNAMCLRYTSMSDNADLITVFGGTNDKGQNLPIGTMADTGTTTFYGACHVLFSGLIAKYPTKTILAITPLQCTGWDNSTIVNAYKQVANYYSIPVLDLFNEGGLTKRVQAVVDTYMPDGLHPNALGHRLIANKIAPFLKNN